MPDTSDYHSPTLNLIFLNGVCIGLHPANTHSRMTTNKVIVTTFRSMGFTDKTQYLINLPGRKDIAQTDIYYSRASFETRYGKRGDYTHQLVFEFYYYFDRLPKHLDTESAAGVNRFNAINRKFGSLYGGGYPCMFLVMPCMRDTKKYFYDSDYRGSYEDMWFCSDWKG